MPWAGQSGGVLLWPRAQNLLTRSARSARFWVMEKQIGPKFLVPVQVAAGRDFRVRRDTDASGGWATVSVFDSAELSELFRLHPRAELR